LTQNQPFNTSLSLSLIKISDFYIFCFLCDFVVLVRHCFIRRLCATLFVFLVSFSYLFDSNCFVRSTSS